MSSQQGPYPIGVRFGPYRLDEYLGSGAFKSVYRAENTETGEIVALGFPHQQDDEGVAELEKEFATGSMVEHPNIMRVFGLERHEGLAILITEYLEGETLRQRLQRDGRFAAEAAVKWIGMICQGLSCAHQHRILHRDLKPDNIFITSDGQAKLLDFGIARLLTRTSARASTRVGTTDYMAPEQFNGAAGMSSDLWALGVTFYELLAGTRPFTGETGKVIHQIMHDRYDEQPLFDAAVDRRIIRVLRKVLQKEPEARYPSADELLIDLESLARGVRVIDDDEGRLEMLIRASVPLIYTVSHEEHRVLDALTHIADRLGEQRHTPRKLYVWSASQGLRESGGKAVSQKTVGDPTGALAHAIDNTEDAIYVLLDIHRHYSPVVTRLIRDCGHAVRNTRKSIVFLSPFYRAPEELRNELNLVVFGLPDALRLREVLGRVEVELETAGLAVELNDDGRRTLVRAAAGLSESEAMLALRAAATRNGKLTIDAARHVIDSKSQIIRKTGILEYFHRSDSFANVGGLKNLTTWFQGRAGVFSGTAAASGIPMPKGVMLVGVPGCGKSLSARALAGSWNVPLLRLDIGRIFGQYVGQSETNLRMALDTAEAVAPCILWIDEIEKGFSGVSGGGAATRVFGSFLSWLQDKRSPVFVVATANDISGLPPEFLRQGRFDDTFFVGLPTKSQREEILGIHLHRRHRSADQFDLPAIAAATARFSGAELEQVVIAGLFTAFSDEQRELTTDDILRAAADTRPLAQSRAREITALIEWANQNAKQAG